MCLDVSRGVDGEVALGEQDTPLREAGDERRGVCAHRGIVPLIPRPEVARNLPGEWVREKRVLFVYYVYYVDLSRNKLINERERELPRGRRAMSAVA